MCGTTGNRHRSLPTFAVKPSPTPAHFLNCPSFNFPQYLQTIRCRATNLIQYFQYLPTFQLISSTVASFCLNCVQYLQTNVARYFNYRSPVEAVFPSTVSNICKLFVAGQLSPTSKRQFLLQLSPIFANYPTIQPIFPPPMLPATDITNCRQAIGAVFILNC